VRMCMCACKGGLSSNGKQASEIRGGWDVSTMREKKGRYCIGFWTWPEANRVAVTGQTRQVCVSKELEASKKRDTARLKG
jgi:hypothetical protein